MYTRIQRSALVAKTQPLDQGVKRTTRIQRSALVAKTQHVATKALIDGRIQRSALVAKTQHVSKDVEDVGSHSKISTSSQDTTGYSLVLLLRSAFKDQH